LRVVAVVVVMSLCFLLFILFFFIFFYPVRCAAVVRRHNSKRPTMEAAPNYARVASSLTAAALELNRAPDAASVREFLDVFDRCFSGNVSLRCVAALIQELGLDADAEGVDRGRRRGRKRPADADAEADADDVAAEADADDVAAEAADRLRGCKTRKVDLLVRRCKERFGEAWVALGDVEQVAAEVGYFSGNSKKLRPELLTQCRRRRSASSSSSSSSVKPWGSTFAYWQCGGGGGDKFRLSPHFFK